MKVTLDYLPNPVRETLSIDSQEAFQECMQTSDSLKLKNWHQEGFEAFLNTAYPSRRNESWRFSKPDAILPTGYVVYPMPDQGTIDLLTMRSNPIENPTAKIIFADGNLVFQEPLSQQLKEQGVFLGSFEEAFKVIPDVIGKYLQKSSPTLGSEKFAALNQAYSTQALCLYVPKGVHIEGTIAIYHWHLGDHAALFPRMLVIAEEDAKANLLELYGSTDEVSSGYICGMSHTYLGKNACIERTSLQELNLKSKGIQIEAAWLEEASHFHHVSLQMGGETFRFENQVFLEGKEAEAALSTLSIAKKEQFLDERSLQVHSAPGATSDLLYKNALFDTSKTVFSGMIIVEPGAQKTDAYQTNRNLVLSDEAEAIALPGLEIEANDVKCSHGATTASVDEDQIFYLQSRGIPRSVGEKLLIGGFFEEVLERIPFNREWVKNTCESILTHRA